jgi:hypothetical protein
MTVEYELPRDPAKGLRLFAEDVAFTPDNPNALSTEGNEIGEFLAMMKATYPQHYAITLLGFAIGHRPSTLRPLRRKGRMADLLFHDDGTARLIVRRSNSRGQEIMESTKTRAVVVVELPKEVADVLKEHIAELDKTALTRRSDLLFPSRITGEIQSKSALQKPFNNVAKGLGLKKRITPKSMRRTFKDLARARHRPHGPALFDRRSGREESRSCRRGEHRHCAGEAGLRGVSIALNPSKSSSGRRDSKPHPQQGGRSHGIPCFSRIGDNGVDAPRHRVTACDFALGNWWATLGARSGRRYWHTPIGCVPSSEGGTKPAQTPTVQSPPSTRQYSLHRSVAVSQP